MQSCDRGLVITAGEGIGRSGERLRVGAGIKERTRSEGDRK